MSRSVLLLLGVLAVTGFTAFWHGPMGAADRLSQRIESEARIRLDRDEMFQVQARLERRPLSRRLILSGPADAFQRAELSRRLDDIPGVVDVRWDIGSMPQEGGMKQ